MRILLFGGSFDPPHIGHAALLAAAASRIRPGRILVVPAYRAPLKEGHGASAGDRLAMIAEGLLPSLPKRWRKTASIERSELAARRTVYTVETLARLARRLPKDELHFLVGSDSAASWALWKDPARLKALATWWTAARPGASRRLAAHFHAVPGRMPDVSSTGIRAALARGEDVSRWLAPAVLQRVESRGLYGRGLLRELEASLKPERYAHSLAVARLASSLAERWGENEGKARLAGLLHDCGRRVSVSRMPAYARRRRLRVPDVKGIVRHNPLLLHAYISEDVARRRFGVVDPAVLSAVRKHTLADRKMSRFDKLLYVADAASEDRAYAGIAGLRRLAFKDLEEAFAACVDHKLRWVIAQGAWAHPLTVSVWNALR